MKQPDRPLDTESATLSAGSPPTVQTHGEATFNSAVLFCGMPFCWIDHGGQRYLLRQTRQGKLILTK